MERNKLEGQTGPPGSYNYRPRTEGQQLRILLHGLLGAGKSSFINSVSTVLQGNMSRIALVGNSNQDSVTKEYKTYRIQRGNHNGFYPFVLNDIMGLKNATRRNRKVYVKDVKRAMKGHVRDGYTDIREEANDLGIPQVAILTKIDTVCPEIQKDIKDVYKSRTLKKRMEEFSALVGIPMYCIFPVKNYHEELQLNNDIDVLVLNALTNIIKVGEEFLNQNNPA
ncbi:interferon-induced protein 44 isoform X2 [Larimichthys crocea]|uniref:interferon-induced protein 44 isoform X2 n=1 Tax=Larimichthys crocea TaxID=215358 RepID=UPI00090185EB|nr:interferon-induced protein 44 isoform X2 [Larimichthys crocea]